MSNDSRRHLLIQSGVKQLTPEQVSVLDNAGLIYLCDAKHNEVPLDAAIYHIANGKTWADVNAELAELWRK